MIEKFEALEEKEELGEITSSFIEVDKKVATHKHICYHDEECMQSCRRVKL